METPKTLKNFDAYEAEYFNAFVQKEQIPAVAVAIFTDFLKKVIDAADLCIRVPISVLPSIIRDGRIKNVMETGTGATMGGASVRKEMTNILFGCNVDELAPNEYPNFGYLGTKNKMLEIFESDLGFHYGDALITLKRENLFDRTTMCIGDTVDFGAFKYVMPTLLSHPRFTCAGWMLHPGVTEDKSLRTLPGVYKLHVLLKAILEEELTVNNFHKMGELFDKICTGFEFFELQFHGGISFPGDVEKVDCYNVWDNENTDMLKQITEQLKPAGIEVKVWDGI